MKTRQSIEKQMFTISEEERANLLALAEDINQIIQKKTVDENTVRKLSNVATVLDTFKDKFLWRLLRAAKQNHMLD
jgi:hypothetical protein|tara:strand:+ start:567 stop:794 length:228 start_codon:yes stop_codon:yes gene_type:complete